MRARELGRVVTYSCLGSFAFLCLENVATLNRCCGNGHAWSLQEPASGGMPYLLCTHPISEDRFERVRKRRLLLLREVHVEGRVPVGWTNEQVET